MTVNPSFGNRMAMDTTPVDQKIKLIASPQERVCDVFVKLGGSILDDAAQTERLMPHLATLAGRYRILVLVGGGRIAKRLKGNQRERHTDFYRSWRAGVLCHDVNAALLASYSTAFEVAATAGEMIRCFDAGKIAVFAPANMLFGNLNFVPDWRITTDSMALYFASTLRADRCVIVSNVDGVHRTWPDSGPPIARISIAELERLPSSKLDSAFPTFFRRYPVPAFVVNGQHPNRVSAAVCGDETVGTEIVLTHAESAQCRTGRA
jgi:5-(aminomethyl)-3-furanmethanol phosphate kinase